MAAVRNLLDHHHAVGAGQWGWAALLTPPPTPLSALYPHSRQLAPRLRVFLDWAATRFREAGL